EARLTAQDRDCCAVRLGRTLKQFVKDFGRGQGCGLRIGRFGGHQKYHQRCVAKGRAVERKLSVRSYTYGLSVFNGILFLRMADKVERILSGMKWFLAHPVRSAASV